MDIQKYIASGILENYILGLVSEQEEREVSTYALQYPEIKAELQAIEDALGTYVQSKAMPMPEGLGSQIMSHIATLSPATPASDATKDSLSDKKTVDNTPKGESTSWLPGLLGAVAFLGLAAATYLYQQGSELKKDLSTKNTQLLNQQLACDEVTKQHQDLQKQLLILRDDAYRSILMKGTPKAPNAVAAIYYNESAKKTYLDVRNLPTPASDKQYQLWAIVDGVPVDMGVFDTPVTDTTFLEVPFLEKPQAFAVTLEPKGGKPSPTMEEMYVIGTI